MNISVYLDDRLAEALRRESKRRRRSRNAAVTEAIRQWLEQSQRSEWPRELLDAKPEPALEPFESWRGEDDREPRFP